MFAEEKAAAASSVLDGISSIIQSILSNILSLPIIILILFIIFRKQFIDLLDKLIHRFTEKKLSEFELGTGGVKLKFDTSLGKTQVSVPKVKIIQEEDFNLTSYIDGLYKFKISWDDEIYHGSKAIGRELEKQIGIASFPFAIIRRKEIDAMIANINILVQSIESKMTIEQYLHQNSIEMKQLSFEVKNSFVDENTNSGFIEYYFEDNYILFQKLVVNNGLGYVITATANSSNLTNPNKTQGFPKHLLNNSEVKGELRNIMNSFTLVTNK